MFNFFKWRSNPNQGLWYRTWSRDGLLLSQSNQNGQRLEDALVGGLLAQLADQGLLVELPDGFALGWDALFEAMADPSNGDLFYSLALPSLNQLRVGLKSHGTLIDSDFSIAIDGWYDAQGRRHDCLGHGAILECGNDRTLMHPVQWNLFSEILRFARRQDDERTDLANRQRWGHIRRLAIAANARMDDFLTKSVVLTPEQLRIQMRKASQPTGDTVIEVIPVFHGAPDNWLERFDAISTIPDLYNIPTNDGSVQVILTDKVRAVLGEIKRMPGRRVAGARAQAFVVNPYATLGEDARDVIVEEEFEAAREEAGLTYERFTPYLDRNESGQLIRVGLLVEQFSTNGWSTSDTLWLDEAGLAKFIQKLEVSISRNFQLVTWEGFEFEILGDTPTYLDWLKSALTELRHPAVLIHFDHVHDLSNYSGRIEKIGEATPLYSPYISKKNEGEGWFPENILPIVAYVPEGEVEPVFVPTSTESLNELSKRVRLAEANNEPSITLPGLPKPIPINEAKNILATFDKVMADAGDGHLDEEKLEPSKGGKRARPVTLVLRSNIEGLDYSEDRADALKALPTAPVHPRGLNPEYSLLQHQLEGLAWLQHLYRLRVSHNVRGALLADDMGLGKTLQILSLITWIEDQGSSAAPVLIVAPVSLLENWSDEAEKFFPGRLPMLTAYGEHLSALRVPQKSIDERLITEDGLVKFLQPGWVGKSKIVLTTYETLRDLEFSFAAQHWSLMVCDEAQKIKNPAAMMTRAAKKQNVEFRIACTGTPVENTLADLWSLFDFIQPGLLGALNEFGRRYRKPIEAKTDEEFERVKELRGLIEPQILRRTKQEVAKLPQKVIVQSCRKLPLSNAQRNLYANAIEDFKRRNEPGFVTPFKNHLGLLHYLRLICTDPRRHGLAAFKPDPIQQYREDAPKMAWLLDQLKDIQSKGEKAIIFCEFKNIQRLLQHYVQAACNFKADIINGDTKASSRHNESRQKRIKAFQAHPGFGIIILSPVAVGFGVNIQAANHVIHYTRTWNPAKEDQATDRAYRIGQTKNVFVYYPVVFAEDFSTFDVKLDQLLEEKRGLAGDMLNGFPDISSCDFSLEDIAPIDSTEGLSPRLTLDDALRMDGRTFEGLTAVLWRKKGYEQVLCTPSSHDNGIDVVAISGKNGVLIQTKSSSDGNRKLGWDAVKDVVTGEAFYKKRYPGVTFVKIGLTNQSFNHQAHENAKLNGVTLVEQPDLANLLNQHEVSMLDVERVLYSDLS